MKQIWQRVHHFPHYLYLLPFFFVLHGYLDYYPAIPFGNCLGLLLKYWLATAVLAGLLFLFIRSWKSAGVLTAILMIFQFFFGALHDGLKAVFSDSLPARYSFLLPVVLIGFALLLFYFQKKKPALPTFARYLNILLLLLLAIDVVSLQIKTTKQIQQQAASPSFMPCDTCSRPDVYLIVADSYAGKAPLQEVLHFDNSVFENALRQRGFYIVDSSRSNYNYTPFTMASMFAMDYLQGLEGHDKNPNDRKICYRHIDQNPVVDFFRTQGYAIKNFSIFRFANQLPLVSTSFYRNGEDLIDVHTFLGRLNRDLRYHAVTRLKIRSEEDRFLYHHKHLNETLYRETWNEIKTPSEQPRFVYTHLEMPHYPYYFDSAGRANPREDLVETKNTDTGNYLSYLKFGNTQYLKLIDHIFAHAKQPPVIVFMSDHGLREYSDSTVDKRYYFMNMNAVYLPGKQYHKFYPGLSTVNQFRILFNSAFGQDLPLRKDSTSLILE